MKLKPEFLSVDFKTGYMDDNAVNGHTWRFIKICKESCEDENVVEAYKKMLDFYKGQMKPKKNTKAVNRMISTYQYVGLVNVVLLIPRILTDEKSMRNGRRLRDRVEISSAIIAERHPTS
ncbi:hypothetical protein Tco_1240923 [Tanacetum coccineum]